jgi:hypothetical protein
MYLGIVKGANGSTVVAEYRVVPRMYYGKGASASSRPARKLLILFWALRCFARTALVAANVSFDVGTIVVCLARVLCCARWIGSIAINFLTFAHRTCFALAAD